MHLGRLHAGTGHAGGEDHRCKMPLAVLAGKSLRNKKRRGHFIAAYDGFHLDGAVHGPVVVIDRLYIHAIDFGVLIVDEALADDLQFLLRTPIATHVDEHGIGMEDVFECVGVLGGHQVPDLLGEVGKRLRLGRMRLVIKHRELALGKGTDAQHQGKGKGE